MALAEENCSSASADAGATRNANVNNAERPLFMPASLTLPDLSTTLRDGAARLACAPPRDRRRVPENRDDARYGSPPGPRDPELQRTAGLITQAFRTEKPEPIASLVPVDGKAYVLLTAAGDGGYYSRDQVYFIFNKVFSQHDTVEFNLRRQENQRDEKPQPGEAPAFTFFVGVWKYHRHDGADAETTIHFLLSMKKGGWALVEIREAQ